MEKIKHEVLVKNWAQNIEQRISSGMTIKEWCQANNIMESQYYYWLKVVRREAVQQAGGGTMAEIQNTFVEIQGPSVPERPATGRRVAATLRWRGIEIDLPEDAPADFIRRLAEGLAYA